MSTRCDQAGWFSYLTYGWVNPLVHTGAERQIHLADTPELAEADDTVANTHRLLVNLNYEERNGRSHPLLRAVVISFWRSLLAMEVLRIASHFIGLIGPLLLQQVLIFQEAQNDKHAPLTQREVSIGITAVCGLFALGLFSMLYDSQLNFFQTRLGLRIGSALRGTLLHRCVKGQPHGTLVAPAANGDGSRGSSTKAPTVYNVLSFDVGPNIDIIWILMAVWIFPIQFFSSMAVLFAQVRWAIVPGLAVIIVAKIITAVLLVGDGFMRDRQLRAKDERLSRCVEGFGSIRTLQMLAWTEPFEQRIMASRARELRAQQTRLWLQKMVAALDYSLGTIVTLATLGYYVVHDGAELKASVAIPVIGLVNGLVGPFGQFPVWANQYLVWRSAYDRVNIYMGLAVHPRQGGGAAGTVGGGGPGPLPPMPPPGTPVATLESCTLTWGSPTGGDEDCESAERPLLADEPAFCLHDLNLQVRGGDLLVLCGQPGNGKSSVLQGLLGEMAVQAGAVRSPAVDRRAAEAADVLLPLSTEEARQALSAGPEGACDCAVDPYGVGYAAQSAALFTGTVRSNILFGSRLDAGLYGRVLKACALETDLSTMPAADFTEVAQGGATLSGGQRARVGLARAIYRALMLAKEQPGRVPLVLLDDPFCALDRRVAREVCHSLFEASGGLLAGCAVVVAAADPWWLSCVQPASANGRHPRLAVLRAGRIVAAGALSDLRGLGLPELASATRVADHRGTDGHGSPAAAAPAPPASWNPQDDEMPEPPPPPPAPLSLARPSKMAEVHTQTPLTDCQKSRGGMVKQEAREAGHVKWGTYLTYLAAVGPGMLTILFVSLTGIMVFQNLCTLWIAYWTSEDKKDTFMYPYIVMFTDHPPEKPSQLWWVFACFTLGFTASNFAGHGLEIVGGIRAARTIFSEALAGTLGRPFRWWDANPTGRVLNRFSEDVEVMDLAVTNIIGVIFGAALYFVGHSLVLAVANPFSLTLLPICALVMELYARYYRVTIREIQRIYLVSMSTVYQDMVEAIVGKVTIRAFASSRQVLWASLDGLDRLQRASFAKSAVGLWIGLRMGLVGYVLNAYTQMHPILQYFGILGPQSAALVGFSIQYSQGVIGIIQQFIMNYSDLEMQLVSIERLQEYAAKGEGDAGPLWLDSQPLNLGGGGLCLRNVQVTYREGLLPALSGVSLDFRQQEAVAIMGRTGAGKTSLLLAVLQLVPYEGTITVGGRCLADVHPAVVRTEIVGVVPQQPVIFAGDLRWNLDPHGARTEAELWEVLKAVGLQGACNLDRDGLSAPSSDDDGSGSSASGDSASPAMLALSQGQQQLLCAARVLLRKPRVVLLDEVTASLPPETAMSTLSGLVKNFKDAKAVVLLVTHQDELLPFCDRVVTVAAGRIAGDERCSNASAASAAA